MGDGVRKIAELTGEALEAAIRERAAIRVYHGSPDVFDKFETAKIGTGEGAQVYGHGLYFTEKEQIAKGYREKLAGPARDKGLGIDSEPVWSGHGGSHYEWNRLQDALNTHMRPEEVAVYEDYLKNLPPGEKRDLLHRMVD